LTASKKEWLKQEKKNLKQNSEEWKDGRRGRITASRFGDVIAKPSSKRHQIYLQQLRLDIKGVPRFERDTPWFDHGKEMEPEARGLYAWEKQVDVEEVGLIVHPKYDFISCSPDGLVGGDGGIEIKSRVVLSGHLKSKKVGVDAVHKPQIQGSLWITVREWWDFVSFYKHKDYTDIHIHRVYPDENYIKMLEEKSLEFWEKVNAP